MKYKYLLLVVLMHAVIIQPAQESKSDNDSDAENFEHYNKRRKLHSHVDEKHVLQDQKKSNIDAINVDNRKKNIANFVQDLKHFDEGFNLLRKKGQKVPTLSSFIDQNLIDESAEDDAQVNKNRFDAGTVIERAEDVIINQMKKPFLTSLSDLVFSPVQDDIYTKISKSNNDILRYVINHDARLQNVIKIWINDTNDFGETLLSKALAADNIYHVNSTVDYLLSLGANPNIADENGKIALHEVSKHVDADIIKKLITATNNVNAQDKDGNTPLSNALINQQFLLFNALCDKGADIALGGDDGFVISLFVSNRLTSQMRCFEHQFWVTPIKQSSHIKSAFFKYTEQFNHELYKKYLQDRQLRQALSNQDTPISLIEKLIQEGSNVNFIPSQVYVHADRDDMDEQIDEDIDQHADEVEAIEPFKDYYKSNLALACKLNRDVTIIQMLLDKGARVNKRSRYNKFKSPLPLHYAIDNLNVAHVKILLEHHADANLKQEPFDFTPLYLAIGNRDNPRVQVLNNPESENQKAAQREIIELLLKAGAGQTLMDHTDDNYNVGGAHGCTNAFMAAVILNRADLVELFLKYDADIIHYKNDAFFGNTALHSASLHNCIETAELLLAQPNIDAFVENEENQTPFDIATTDEMKALLS